MQLDDETARRLRVAFPAALRDDVDRVLERLPSPTHPASADDIGEVKVNGERVGIPARIHLPGVGVPHLGDLDARQRRILACIYTRHHDGYIREAALKELLPPEAAFEAPFIIQLVGEYVVEIVQVILAHRDELRTPEFQTFVRENEAFLARTRQRAMSYWDCYYRGACAPWFRRAEYPGLLVLDDLAEHSR